MRMIRSKSIILFSIGTVFLVVLLSNYLLAETGLREPKWIGITKDGESIYLRWFRVQDAVTYIVQRRIGEQGEFQQLASVTNPTFNDHSILPGNVYFYRIIPVDNIGSHGSPSEVRYFRLEQPEEKTLSPPEWVAGQVMIDGVSLAWHHENYKNILAFNIYRKREGEDTFTLVGSTPGVVYLDRDVTFENTYHYMLTALDLKLQESVNSSTLTVKYAEAALPALVDDRFSGINTIEEVVQKTELDKIYSWETYGFISPVDVEYSITEDRLYVSDSGTGLITVIEADGQLVNQLGGNGDEPWAFDRLLGIALDPAGYVYGVDGYRGEIVVFSAHGTFERRIRLEDEVREYFGPDLNKRYPWFRFGIVDVLVAGDGSLFIVDNPNGWIYVLDKNDKLINIISEKGYEPGKMQYPTFAAFDGGGRIVVSDTLNSRIQFFEMDGSISDLMGERGPGIGQFLRPKGIAVDRRGNYFIADSQLNVIQVFDSDLQFVALLGDERNLPIDLGSPNGVAFIKPDRLVICERLARRVQVRRLTFDLTEGGRHRYAPISETASRAGTE
jgi:fibronectin type 3 domain-containing protein